MKVPNELVKACKQAELYFKRNSSTFLTFVGAVGVIGTAVTAVKATPKALLILNEAKEEKGEELTKFEMIRVAGTIYIPSVLIGLSTICCIFGANVLNKRQQAALTSAYALLENSYKEYRQKAKEIYGEEADVQIRESIVKDKAKDDWNAYVPGLKSLDIQDDICLFYDEIGGRYFESTPSKVFNAEYHLNRNFALKGCASLNEFYDFLGLDYAEEGDALGWSADHFLEGGMCPWIDFDHKTISIEDGSDEGLKCIIIYPEVGPSIGYNIY